MPGLMAGPAGGSTAAVVDRGRGIGGAISLGFYVASLSRLLCWLSCPLQLISHMIDCSRATKEAEECVVSRARESVETEQTDEETELSFAF